MSQTYYRLHREDAPTFTADNAWSAVWGETYNAAGDRYECSNCDATGIAYGEPCGDCNNGWIDCQPGYSACHSAAELLEYFDQHCKADDIDPVVIFDGEHVGNGCDGEPLVIPINVIRWTTIGALRATEQETP